jgi:hypothetical protein
MMSLIRTGRPPFNFFQSKPGPAGPEGALREYCYRSDPFCGHPPAGLALPGGAAMRMKAERVAAMGPGEEEGRVLAVLQEMLDAQEVGNVGRVLATFSGRPEAAHMATDGVNWESSWEAAHAVTAVPVDGLRLVADRFTVHFQGGVAWAEGMGRVSNRGGAERPVRMSCVLIRERGQWVIVQSHASLPVTDTEIFKLETGC